MTRARLDLHPTLGIPDFANSCNSDCDSMQELSGTQPFEDLINGSQVGVARAAVVLKLEEPVHRELAKCLQNSSTTYD